jgi:hypothetical protein
MEFQAETTTADNSYYKITDSPKKSRTFVSVRQKQTIAEEALRKPRNYSHTARKYNITLSQVQRYVKQFPVLQTTFGKKLTIHPGTV